MPEIYLYGAAVQGIQGFIFQTNTLKDIVGASELVNLICTKMFKECVGSGWKDARKIMTAAGNVKYKFTSREECERVVREFPKKVMQAAPGITISQAVVRITDYDTSKFKEYIDALEKKLRAQRNKPAKSTTIGCMGILRSRQTGLPVVEEEKNEDGSIEYLDDSTQKKRHLKKIAELGLCESAFGTQVRQDVYPKDVGKMCGKNSWLAVIHADGNGLGQIIQNIGDEEAIFKTFSRELDKATKTAALSAYHELLKMDNELNGEVIPIRPIVLGGDDFTIICRGSIAMDYVTAYLRNFEESTGKMMEDINKMLKEKGKPKRYDGLTACAGIAFIKSNYPFYYGYNLAEALCSEAKKDAKSKKRKREDGQSRSCLMFHKVQDSFITDYADIERRELTPIEGYTYKFGPYYLEDMKDKMMIDTLLEYAGNLKGQDGRNLKPHLRRWMTCLAEDGSGAAEQLQQRIEQMTPSQELKKTLKEILSPKEILTADGKKIKALPVYDILSLCSINED